MKVGIYKISNEAYHQGEGLSSTDIKELMKSPLHFEAYKAEPKEETKEMLLGSMVHCLILEPEMFDNTFAVGDFNTRRGKEYDRVCTDNPDKKIVSREEFEEAKVIVEKFFEEVRQNPLLEKLLQGVKETAFYWNDKKTGLLCKAKTDVLGDGFITDLKTARDASYDGFQRAIVDLKYFVSAAMYLRGVKETIEQMGGELPSFLKRLPEAFAFIVIETKAPYGVALYYLDETAIRFGEQLIDRALGRYAKGLETKEWSAFPRKVIEISLPNYAMYKYNYVGGDE